MKIILKDNRKYIIRLDRGEELVEELKKFCQAKNIKAAQFWAIGAAREAELAHYDIDKKHYSNKVLRQKLEIDSLSGTIAQMDEKPLVHAHAVLSDETMQVQAGHINRLIVAATCEIYLEILKGKLIRQYDKSTGLNLLKKQE